MIVKGLVWEFLGRFSSHLFSFVFSIFLARILLPEDFGIVAIGLVFINLSQIFIDGGFGAALIQKKEVSQKLYSSVFWINVVMGVFLTLLFYFLAPFIANFYESQELTLLIQIMAGSFLLSSLGVIQQIQYSKKMNFKSLAIITLISTIVSGGIAVWGAYNNWGYWALVLQHLINVLIRTLLLWLLNHWRPLFYFSMQELKTVWAFSSRKLANEILANIINATDTLTIGKIFSSSVLGVYNRAKYISELVKTYSSGSLTNVLFPAISNIQDDIKRVKKLYFDFLEIASILSVFITLILFMNTKELILMLYTEKWEQSIPILKLFIWASFLYPLNAISLNLLMGMGYIHIAFNLGLLKKVFRVIGLVLAYFMGLEYFAFFISFQFLISFILNTIAVNIKMKFKYKDQFLPVLKNLTLGLISYIITFYAIKIISLDNLLVSLVLKSSIILLSYLILQLIFNKNQLFQIKSKIRLVKNDSKAFFKKNRK